MSESSQGSVDRILSRERNQSEETKKFNAERQIILGLAPEMWRELKDAIKEQCESIARHSDKCIECDEPTVYSMKISRFYGDTAIPVGKLIYNPDIPAVRSEYQRLGRTMVNTLRFSLVNGSLFFHENNQGVIISEFVSNMMIDLTR